MSRKVLIVGCTAGGASAAARLRRLDENAEIIMFEKDENITFADCEVLYYIDVRINSEVVSVDSRNKKVTVKTKAGECYEEGYDNLILCPGAKVIMPTIPGINSSKLFTLSNISDTDNLKTFLDKQEAKKAVVIGGGLVGVEMAGSLRKMGLEVILVVAAPHILEAFDWEMAAFAEKKLEEHDIELILNDHVKAFEEKGNSIEVILNSGVRISADIIILAVEAAPDTVFLKDSGIELGTKGHILVNGHMQTKSEGVYAVGDAVEIADYMKGQRTAITLIGAANKQGRIAADNVMGLNSVYKGVQETSVINVFSLTGAAVGNNERTLERMNIPHKVIYVHPLSHDSYYTEETPISIKLIFNDEGRILGAQAFGYEGVEKRIDNIAVVIQMGGTVTDLTELEFSYNPTYESKTDPVNTAGYAAENVITGRAEVITLKELKNYDKNRIILVDVRSEIEFENGYIEGAVNIPVDVLRERIEELDKNQEIWVYCEVGLRGYIAARMLSQYGYKVKNFTGGYITYSIANYKLYKKDQDLEKLVLNVDTKRIEKEEANIKEISFDKNLNACGLSCPGPLMQVKMCADGLNKGQVLKVTASDPGFYGDINSWCRRTNNELLSISQDKGIITVFIKKGEEGEKDLKNVPTAPTKDNKTLIVFSGDLDKAIAAFIIANGAASMGRKVTMFFTFWGLNIIRRPEKIKVQKGFMDKIFGMMMPRGSKKLGLSKMNMLGMGGKMIRKVMKDKNISSLEDLIKAAMDSGIEVVACQMSMDVMGIKKEELLDGVKIGGVGYYLGEAEDANVNLFV